MYITESFNNQLDDLLVRICEKLQISESQHKLAQERYKAVAKWLSREESPLSDVDIDIYPQGSLRIGTTVKPLKKEEYDLDLVCELGIDWNKNCPIEILNTVEKCLKENKTYKPMVERMNRCIRLNYAKEFHMDILPAAPDFHKNGGCVKVPDRKVENWKDSNPRGYAKWFEKKSEEFIRVLLEKAAAAAEPLPDHEPLERKTPLQRSVQLIKRYRDVTFQNNSELAPISIVLTTLAGTHYQGQESVANTISFVLSKIIQSISKEHRLVVLNPTNSDENLSEKWDKKPQLYAEFTRWIKEFDAAWKELKNKVGIPQVRDSLAKMFGENITDIAINEQAEYIEKARRSGKIGISSGVGAITAASTDAIPVRENTFYGEEI